MFQLMVQSEKYHIKKTKIIKFNQVFQYKEQSRTLPTVAPTIVLGGLRRSFVMFLFYTKMPRNTRRPLIGERVSVKP